MIIEFCFGAPICNNRFPKILGGTRDNTFINDMDANEDLIVVCGDTFDDYLSHNPLSLANIPIIAAFDVLSTSLKWGFSDSSI